MSVGRTTYGDYKVSGSAKQMATESSLDILVVDNS